MNHYKEIADNFENVWFFDENYFERLTQILFKHLNFKSNEKYIDFGCGTGHYDQALLNLAANSQIELSLPIFGVDLSEQMLEKFKMRGENFIGVHASIEDFVKEDHFSYDKLLLKEVIHHVKTPVEFYKNISNIISDKGKAIIATRPKKLDFPFFQKALDDFSKSQPALDEILSHINEADCLDHKVTTERINIEMSFTRLTEMIRGRFMSFFHSYNDDQIELGLKELSKKFESKQKILFQDTFFFIELTKKRP